MGQLLLHVHVFDCFIIETSASLYIWVNHKRTLDIADTIPNAVFWWDLIVSCTLEFDFEFELSKYMIWFTVQLAGGSI